MAMNSNNKVKEAYVCTECGADYHQWMGRCSACHEWNTVKAIKLHTNADKHNPSKMGPLTRLAEQSKFIPMDSITTTVSVPRKQIFSQETNRILGGGLVPGSVVLLSGEPGVGKSTLLLQIGVGIAASIGSSSKDVGPIVYISGEETAQQLVGRAQRLNLSTANISLLCDTNIDRAVELISEMNVPPSLLLIDSIQTMQTDNHESSNFAVGSVAQIKDATTKIIQLAKTKDIPTIMLGHVTKTGDIGGPRLLEHMVDVVLTLEPSGADNLRILRGVKNRFGPTSEVGILEMTSNGLIDVANPSGTFLSRSLVSTDQEGSAVAVVMEGSRAIMMEVQCLVGKANAAVDAVKIIPRRTADGFSLQRLSLLCAVIEKRLHLPLSRSDIFLNVVGGLKLVEPSSDLAVAMALISSRMDMSVHQGTAFIGEIGLRGELREGCRHAERRIAEAGKLGFSRIVLPTSSSTRTRVDSRDSREDDVASSHKFGMEAMTHSSSQSGIEVIRCSTLSEAVDKSVVGGLAAIRQALAKKKAKEVKVSDHAQSFSGHEDYE